MYRIYRWYIKLHTVFVNKMKIPKVMLELS